MPVAVASISREGTTNKTLIQLESGQACSALLGMSGAIAIELLP